jgi:hypothetical protein
MLKLKQRVAEEEAFTRRGPTADFGDLIIAQADGELLRCSRHLEGESQTLVETASALVALAATAGKWPAWVDMSSGSERIIAVAFDEQIVFMALCDRDEHVSRAAFIERARALVAGR